MTSYGVESSKLKEAKDKFPPITLRSFIDPTQPWVLVPNGSLLGFFDWVPERLRVGPWKPIAPVILVIMSAFIVQTRPTRLLYDSPATLVSHYPEMYSSYWWYNVTAFVVMTYMIVWVVINRTKGVVVTYTVISWMMNAIRHCLNALAPFLYDHHILLQINRMLRFPALVTASITFSVWNTILLPYIYILVLDTKEKRFNFTVWNLSFRLVQKHVCNVIYATLTCIVACRSEDMVKANTSLLFSDEDFWYALTFGYAYGLFYNLVLDRLGVHVYPIFSPRSNLVFVTWLGVLGINFVFYKMWNTVIEKHMEHLQMKTLLSICVLLTSISTVIGFFLSKYKAKILKSSEQDKTNVKEEAKS